MYDCKACRKVRYAEHRDERAAYDKEYSQTERGKEATREASYKYRQSKRGKETYRRYWQTAKCRAAARRASRKRRARMAGAEMGPVSEQAVYKRDGHECVYCGSVEDLVLDHVVPLVQGGEHCEDNLVVACRSCNASKGGKLLSEWEGPK